MLDGDQLGDEVLLFLQAGLLDLGGTAAGPAPCAGRPCTWSSHGRATRRAGARPAAPRVTAGVPERVVRSAGRTGPVAIGVGTTGVGMTGAATGSASGATTSACSCIRRTSVSTAAINSAWLRSADSTTGSASTRAASTTGSGSTTGAGSVRTTVSVGLDGLGRHRRLVGGVGLRALGELGRDLLEVDRLAPHLGLSPRASPRHSYCRGRHCAAFYNQSRVHTFLIVRVT